jgi:hypothetical protein
MLNGQTPPLPALTEGDVIDAQRDQLIGGIEKQLRQRHEIKPVFSFRWNLV